MTNKDKTHKHQLHNEKVLCTLVIMALATIKVPSATTGLIAASRQNVHHRRWQIVTCSIGPVTKRTKIRFPPQRTTLRVGTHKNPVGKNSRRVRAAEHRWNARHWCTPQ